MQRHTLKPLEWLAVWAVFGAGVGRLIAKDTIMMLPRNAFLTNVLGVGLTPSGRHHDDIAGAVRNGIFPLESNWDDAKAYAPDVKRAMYAAGVCCPSCTSFWAILVARLALEPHGVLRPRWWRDQFAAWAVAGILTRIGG